MILALHVAERGPRFSGPFEVLVLSGFRSFKMPSALTNPKGPPVPPKDEAPRTARQLDEAQKKSQDLGSRGSKETGSAGHDLESQETVCPPYHASSHALLLSSH